MKSSSVNSSWHNEQWKRVLLYRITPMGDAGGADEEGVSCRDDTGKDGVGCQDDTDKDGVGCWEDTVKDGAGCHIDTDKDGVGCLDDSAEDGVSADEDVDGCPGIGAEGTQKKDFSFYYFVYSSWLNSKYTAPSF